MEGAGTKSESLKSVDIVHKHIQGVVRILVQNLILVRGKHILIIENQSQLINSRYLKNDRGMVAKNILESHSEADWLFAGQVSASIHCHVLARRLLVDAERHVGVLHREAREGALNVEVVDFLPFWVADITPLATRVHNNYRLERRQNQTRSNQVNSKLITY